MNPNLQAIINDPELLKVATPEELEFIEHQLIAETALQSPIDYASFDDPEYVRSPMHELISEKITLLMDGKLLKPDGTPYKKLMIRTPPQMGKSTLATVNTGRWILTKWPDKDVMSLSYNADFASEFGRAIRDGIVEHADTFGVDIAKDNRSITNFGIAGHKGSLLAVGLGGGVTGHPADVILTDDPIKNAEEALSPTQRDAAWEQYGSAVKSRIKPHTIQIFTYTHWHGDDVGARILLNEPDDWCVLVIPAIAMKEDDPLGRTIGQGIEIAGYPFDLTTEWWEHLRSQTIPWIWSALYQQEPMIEGAGLFKKEHVRYAQFVNYDGGHYIRLLKPDQTPSYQDYDLAKCWSFATSDLAATQKNYSDYTVVSSYLVTPDWNLIHIDHFRDRVDSSEHEGLIDRYLLKWKQRFNAVENKVFGITLIQTMIRKGKRVRKSEADTDKYTRAIIASTYMQAGRIYFLQGEPWLETLFEELFMFDKGPHNDQVDCLSYAARILAEHEKNPYQQKKDNDPKNNDELFWQLLEKKHSKRKRKRTAYNPDF